MSSPVPGFPRSLLLTALLMSVCILVAGLIRWRGGYRPRLPLEHSNVAYSLATGAGYSNPFGVSSGPTAWVPPGIPFLYAGAIRLSRATGTDERAPIAGLNLLAAAAAVFLTLKVCLSGWRPRSRAAFSIAFLGYGMLDPDFLADAGPLTAAATALLLAGLASAFRQPGRRAPWVLVFAGNTLLAAIHPGLALAGTLASIAAAFQIARTSAVGPAASIGLAAIAGIAVVTGPWTLRNYLVFHELIPSKSNGCFEMVLSQQETQDGVLSEGSLLVGHPSTNPRLLAEYVTLGEAKFLEPYRREASDILSNDLRRYLMFSLNRLFNATCLSRSPADIALLSAKLEPGQAARLVGRRLILMCAGTPNFFWPPAAVPPETELAGLRSAGIEDPGPLLADWARAQGMIRSRTEGPAIWLEGFAWSGFPTLCLAAALIAARRSTPRLVLAAAAIYLVALVPNVLITHDIRHQSSFVLLFAVIVAGAAESLARSSHG
jgi:hypothetical protein